jgi:hypothetical protein
VFERFTDRARRVLVLAQEEARLLDQNFIGTEHILLGLIHEGDGLAAQALTSLGITLEAARGQVEETIDRPTSTPTGSPPFTPRVKKLLELSLREALQLGHKGIDTEHLLLGLARQGESVAVQVLTDLGVDLDEVRARLITLMSQLGYQPSDEGAFVVDSAAEGQDDVPLVTRLHGRVHRPVSGVRRLRAVVPTLYGWVVGIIDPAQRYMLRASGRERPRRAARGTSTYGPLIIGPPRWRQREEPVTSVPLQVERRFRQRAEERAARLEAVMQTFGPLLEAGVQDLLERSETVMVTPSAEVSARIVRFRWGDSVLHVGVRREWRTERGKGVEAVHETMTETLARLPRAGTNAETLKRYLASDLAELADQ